MKGPAGHGEAGPDTAGVAAPPPFFFVAGLGAGLLIDRARPAPRLPRGARRTLGLPLLAAGVLLIGWAVRTMYQAGTPAPPTQPTVTIVIEGPFRFTRNPIYLGMTLCYIGLTLLSDRLWALALLPAVLAALHRGVVVREEGYLEQRFGEPYRRYRQGVPRWL
jgi:protein-S-isoprenylcysteine O-methyltransferase Ste14